MQVAISRALDFCQAVLMRVGTGEADAKTIAHHLIEADSMNVRSHGLLRLPRYVEQIESGYIHNRARPVLTRLGPGLVQVDAKRNWGILALEALVPELVALARNQGIAGGSVINCSHTGRIGAFSEALAREFMWGQVFGGGANRRLREVAPWGGAKGVFDTNPYAFSAPISPDLVSTSDFATSATAQGKVLVYRTNRKPLPEGWIIDKEGRPSTDPEDFYDDGALLPSGAHKGYGMGFLAELFGDAALGEAHELNWFAIAVDLQRFGGREAYFRRAGALRDKIESCPPAEGFDRVRWPGQPEIESSRRAEAARSIEYSAQELLQLSDLGARFELEL